MKALRGAALAVILSTTALIPMAMAEDVPPGVQAMLDSISRQTGIKPTYEKLEQNADGTVKIGGLSLAVPASATEPALKVTAADVAIAGLADQGDGLYQLGSVKFSGVKLDVTGPEVSTSVSMPEGTAEDWYIKAAGANPTPLDQVRSTMNVARRMSTGPLTISAMGQTITIGGYEQTWDGDPRSGAGTYNLKVTGIDIPEQVVALADQGGMLKQLGYGALNFDVLSTSKLAVDGDKLGMDFDLALSGRDIGKVTVAGAATGIPAEAYAELQKSSSSGQQPNFSAMMPQLQGITIDSASLRFDDASVTKRVLPILAAMQGTDETTLVSTAGAMVQIGLMQLQSPQFAEEAAKAVNAYMKDPKSITLSAKPSAPVTVSDLMALDPTKPQDALTKLGISVRAND